MAIKRKLKRRNPATSKARKERIAHWRKQEQRDKRNTFVQGAALVFARVEATRLAGSRHTPNVMTCVQLADDLAKALELAGHFDELPAPGAE
jgi:hypothetical protein